MKNIDEWIIETVSNWAYAGSRRQDTFEVSDAFKIEDFA